MKRLRAVLLHLEGGTTSLPGSKSVAGNVTARELASMIDHTVLKPGTTEKDVRLLCKEAEEYNFVAVCVPPLHVALASSLLKGKPTKVCSVVGFPLGSAPTSTKVLETQGAIRDGAEEIDMVLCIDKLRHGDEKYVLNDIKAVADVCRKSPKKVLLKVILETSVLTLEEKRLACELSIQGKADFVKTSTGVYGNATAEDVKLLSDAVKSAGLGVKASGGIRTLAHAQQMIAAGATRLGTSSGVKITKELLSNSEQCPVTSSAPRIVVVGSSNMDLISYVPALPRPGETVIGTRFEPGFGGKGANQAVIAAKLGAQVEMVCKVGTDSFGKDMIDNFDKHCIRTAHVSRWAGGSSGVAPISVDAKGENNIVVVPGANFQMTKEDVNAAKRSIEQSAVMLCQNEIPIEVTHHALKLGKESGCLTIFNVAPAPLDTKESTFPSAIYRVTDILCVNETELETLSGLPTDDLFAMKKAAKSLLERGVRHVIVTLGKKGALLLSQNPEFNGQHIPAAQIPADKVIDSVGAGDCFTGSLAFFLASGKPLPDAIRRANFVAGMSVQKKGTQSSYPSRGEIPADILE